MNIARTHGVVFSPCGGALKALRIMEGVLPPPVSECHLTLPANRKTPRTFGPEDLVFMAFPVYGGRLPRMADEAFACLTADRTPAVLIAAYGNRDYEDTLLEMQRLAEGRGFVPFAAAAVLAEHVMAPEVAAGRPDTQDKAGLEHFAGAAFARAQELASAADIAFTAPGQEPYRKPPLQVPFTPESLDNCIRCNICATCCPTAAISLDDPKRIADPERCIACMACVRNCRDHARTVTHPGFAQTAQRLRDTFMPRREPEFFL